MRILFFLLFIAFSINAVAQNNDYLITMEGIGAVKIGMKQIELEKILNKKIPLTNPLDTISGSWQDSAKIIYKNIKMLLQFQRNYFAQDTFDMMITGIETNSPLCKTKNRIGIGSGKQQIIDAFENYFIIMAPEYEDSTDQRSKNRYYIKVREGYEGGEIKFSLTNKKVTSINLGIFYDDSE